MSKYHNSIIVTVAVEVVTLSTILSIPDSVLAPPNLSAVLRSSSMLLPQGFCTGCFLSLEPFPDCLPESFPHYILFFLKCHHPLRESPPGLLHLNRPCLTYTLHLLLPGFSPFHSSLPDRYRLDDRYLLPTVTRAGTLLCFLLCPQLLDQCPAFSKY